MTGQHDRAVEAVLDAHRAGRDVGEWTAHVLASAAATLGSTGRLFANRPGSWEASLARQLVEGTVGEDDEHLAAYAPGGGHE